MQFFCVDKHHYTLLQRVSSLFDIDVLNMYSQYKYVQYCQISYT